MIIFFYGDDDFSSRRFLKDLKEKFVKEVDPSAASLSVLDGRSLDLKGLGEKINTGSLFVRKRFIVIENIFANKDNQLFKNLTAYLKKKDNDANNILVFYEDHEPTAGKNLTTAAKTLFSFLVKQPYSKEFKPLSRSGIIKFITEEAATYQSSIEAPAARRLAELGNNDLWLVARSLKKLAFQNKGHNINRQAVEKSVSGPFDENIFALTDALSIRNRDTAARLLEEQYAAGLSQAYLITMLNRQFKILLRLRTALDNHLTPAEISSRLKLHPFVIKKGLTQAKNFTALQLKKYLNKMMDLDFRNKSGQANVKTELLLLISQI